MSRTLRAFWLLMLAPVLLSAQAFPLPAEADAAAILTALESSKNGWNEANLAKHVALYTDSATFMTATGPRPGRDRVAQQFAATYFKDGKPNQALSFTAVTMRALGKDYVLMNGNFHLTGGNQPEASGWFTLVWQRTAKGWLAIHDHSS